MRAAGAGRGSRPKSGGMFRGDEEKCSRYPISAIACLWGTHLVGIDNMMEEPNKEQRVCGLIW